jgi:hypothetical protein
MQLSQVATQCAPMQSRPRRSLHHRRVGSATREPQPGPYRPAGRVLVVFLSVSAQLVYSCQGPRNGGKGPATPDSDAAAVRAGLVSNYLSARSWRLGLRSPGKAAYTAKVAEQHYDTVVATLLTAQLGGAWAAQRGMPRHVLYRPDFGEWD